MTVGLEKHTARTKYLLVPSVVATRHGVSQRTEKEEDESGFQLEEGEQGTAADFLVVQGLRL